MINNPTFMKLASHIRLLILDVDGVLTDGGLTYDSNGQELKTFSVLDGHGMVALQQAGIAIAIITGRNSQAVTTRMKELRIKHVYQGQANKQVAFAELLAHYQITANQVAYMGDDIPDLIVMQQVALPIAVANAVTAIKESTPWQTTQSGGKGAVREVCDALLVAQATASSFAQTETTSS